MSAAPGSNRRARRELLALESGASASVAEIALRHGFGHPGRFAAATVTGSGELPSETVRRDSARGSSISE